MHMNMYMYIFYWFFFSGEPYYNGTKKALRGQCLLVYFRQLYPTGKLAVYLLFDIE